MAPNELTELREMKELLQKHISDFRVFTTKLLGDDEGELPTGRIPTLESITAKLSRRVARLEGLVLMAFGGFSVVKIFGWVAELWYHTQGATKQ